MKGKHNSDEKSYVPSDTVLRYFKDRVTLSRKIQQFDSVGEEIPDEIKREDGNLRKRKVEILDNHIFPSMANLVIFFKYIAENDQLRDLFEEDIKELVGINYNVIGTFLDSLLTWDMDKDPNNFRQGLIYDIQLIIRSKITGLAIKEFGDVGVDYIIDNHMNQAVAWTRLYYSRYDKSDQGKEDKNQLPKRPIR